MTAPDPKEFGKQIAHLRKARGFSQVDLANASGVSITAIRRCEQNGRISLDRFLILASVLDASLKVVQTSSHASESGNHPKPPPYQSIEDVIWSAQKRSSTPSAAQTHEIRKPRLGGLFGKIKQASPA